MKDFRDLTVWQKAMDLVTEVYKITKRFPRVELYALSDQIRRAAVSIPSNIAEGYGRNGQKEYCRYLNIARGSKYEVETQLMISVRLGYSDEEQIRTAMTLCDEIGKMLNAMIAKLSPDP